MKNRQIVVFSFLICLPAVLLLSIGSWLIAANVPRAIRTAPSRIGREYRETAEGLIERSVSATGMGERKKGWRQTGKIDGRPWGYVIEGERVRVWTLDADGNCRWVERQVIRPFPYELVFYWGGGLVGLVLILLSAFAVACLVRFMRERDEFLAATAHDLTTPLVGMRRMIGRDDEEAKRLNERMILLVDNIKNFLQLGGERKKPDLKPVDIVALTREAYSLFAADYADSEGGPVSFSNLFPVPSSPFLSVMADETMTLQILWNLFGNDLKYAAPYGKVEVRFVTDKEGEEKRLDGEAGTPPLRRCGVSPHQSQCPAIIPKEKNVTVEFADEGPGMSPRQMRKAFDRYYRAKTVLTSGKGGFGIGLCTAREFARAMGGDLTVRANQPKGCVFALTLRLVV